MTTATTTPVIQLILCFLIALQPKLTQDQDDPDKMRGYYRIFVEAGEWYTPLILRHPETFLPTVPAIRSCCDYEDLEVFGITQLLTSTPVWHKLSSAISTIPTIPALKSARKPMISSNRVFPLLNENNASTISDVIDDYIHLLSSLMDYQDQILISLNCFHQSFPLVLTCLEFFDPEPIFTSLNYIREILGHSSLELQAAASSSSGAGGKPGSATSNAAPGSNQVSIPVAPAGYNLLAQSINQLVTQNGYLTSDVLLKRTLTDFPEDCLSTVIILFRLLADFYPTQLASWVPSVIERLPPKVATIPDKEKFLLAFKQQALSLC
ncbi:hypothetical protein PtA15_13A34 [Puccinia triticina]|uniref:Uncharacterized protein n=1 Tax=Puccinia triticina TaxID=208348 RepID=A0ABY7D3Q9_9BASI|nr:uncharacterized protein PtA15_13A34 [Puccinia triticina]WAQ90635.1 hypothetical protein PtA15_13A34 [Puccinia triticina]